MGLIVRGLTAEGGREGGREVEEVLEMLVRASAGTGFVHEVREGGREGGRKRGREKACFAWSRITSCPSSGYFASFKVSLPPSLPPSLLPPSGLLEGRHECLHSPVVRLGQWSLCRARHKTAHFPPYLPPSLPPSLLSSFRPSGRTI